MDDIFFYDLYWLGWLINSILLIIIESDIHTFYSEELYTTLHEKTFIHFLFSIVRILLMSYVEKVSLKWHSVQIFREIVFTIVRRISFKNIVRISNLQKLILFSNVIQEVHLLTVSDVNIFLLINVSWQQASVWQPWIQPSPAWLGVQLSPSASFVTNQA